MAYTKDYYHILGLDAPSWRSAKHNSNINNHFTTDLRRAYKGALLAAHPDKKKSHGGKTTTTAAAAAAAAAGYTIDDIKEAYTTLVDPGTRTQYETWFLHHRDALPTTTSSSVAVVETTDKAENDFILGLEVLDLSEFECMSTSKSTQEQEAEAEGEEEEERMQWTRACRCGADKGFLILEEELEDAEARGEKEVLVGCEGCSLWVRVGFDVEEG